MNRAARDGETIWLAMAAAVPFYFNAALSIVPLVLYHVTLGAILVTRTRRPDVIVPRGFLRALAIAAFFFYFVDGLAISRSLIRATGHLLFFIAAYQAIDRDVERNRVERILVICLIALASIATSTHITITAFVAAFAFLLLRELMAMSREESAMIAGVHDLPPLERRSTGVYMAILLVAATVVFPLLPRVRNPFVRGAGFSSRGASTGFSDSIDLDSGRVVTPDARVVARVTIPLEATPAFTPIRLRGGQYDRYVGGRWTSRATRTIQRPSAGDDGFVIARSRSAGHTIRIRQTRTSAQNQRLYLPVGTWKLSGPATLVEGPNQGSYLLPGPGEALIELRADAGRDVEPLTPPRRLPSYEVSPAIRALADSIAGDAIGAAPNAEAIESYLSTRFTYVSSLDSLEGAIGVEEFLLTERRGHCEHFATGMVLLLAARGVPARVAGGYYGGEYNPLGGYWVIRQRDAHAWVEVWDGTRWTTWDPTPSDLRPGSDTPNVVAAYVSAVAESINFFWDRYILTFGLSDQVNLLLSGMYAARDTIARVRNGLGSIASLASGGMAILPALAIVLVAVALIARQRNRRVTLFDRLATRLAKSGLVVAPSMTGGELVVLVRTARPAIAPFVERIVTLYERDRFSPIPLTRDERAAATLALREIGP